MIFSAFSLTKEKDKFFIKSVLLQLLGFLPVFFWHFFSFLSSDPFAELQHSAPTCWCSPPAL